MLCDAHGQAQLRGGEEATCSSLSEIQASALDCDVLSFFFFCLRVCTLFRRPFSLVVHRVIRHVSTVPSLFLSLVCFSLSIPTVTDDINAMR